MWYFEIGYRRDGFWRCTYRSGTYATEQVARKVAVECCEMPSMYPLGYRLIEEIDTDNPRFGAGEAGHPDNYGDR